MKYNQISTRKKLSLLLIWVVLMLCVLPARPVAAHGEGGMLQLADTPVGPYIVNVESFPGVLRPGETTMSVLVTDAARRSPVTDVNVFLQVVSLEDGNTLKYQAIPTDYSGIYDANVTLTEIGRYQITTIVTDVNRQGGQTSFEVNIAPAIEMQILSCIFLIHLIIVVIWLVKEGKRTWGFTPR